VGALRCVGPFNEKLGYGEIVSYGRDGKSGGTGLDRDLIVRFPSESNADWNKQQARGLNIRSERLEPPSLERVVMPAAKQGQPSCRHAPAPPQGKVSLPVAFVRHAVRVKGSGRE